MFTKWGKCYRNVTTSTGATTGSVPALSRSATNAVVPLKTATGTSAYGSMIVEHANDSLLTAYNNSGYVLGSGNTPATEDDYELQSLITTLTGTYANILIYDETNHCYKMRTTLTVSNPTSASITISEVGKLVAVRTGTTRGGSTNTTSYVLIFRTVLDTPVTIPSDESSIIAFDYVYPSE